MAKVRVGINGFGRIGRIPSVPDFGNYHPPF